VTARSHFLNAARAAPFTFQPAALSGSSSSSGSHALARLVVALGQQAQRLAHSSASSWSPIASARSKHSMRPHSTFAPATTAVLPDLALVRVDGDGPVEVVQGAVVLA